MRWRGQRESGNIEDRRGMTPGRGAGIGLGGIVLVLAVSYITGTNPLQILNMLSGVQDMTAPSADVQRGPTGAPKDQLGRFAAVVLADTEDTWKELLPAVGQEYQEPQLVLFTTAVHSACGTASSAVGPLAIKSAMMASSRRETVSGSMPGFTSAVISTMPSCANS